MVKANIDEQITLKEIALIACMTEQSFCRFFKKKTGKKFFEYLKGLPMKYAVELLIHLLKKAAQTGSDLQEKFF
ncbi:MAG: helix-turn-helix transcriptional regulator [Ferruginibacter sp.]|nr:helix-turn-helix transcriptional regulator [Ferruginibacter sp.]